MSRPYDCARRAWHNDRHKPIRGSLIQEIFRVVNEIHSSATKKNKEWQEKLPIVVLKAEEILYCKANSEAEYMDLKTLWDRTNDAINMIIRRDESTETGELLHPCIEAALILGCVPRRASRSQRNSSRRCYLSHITQEPASMPPSVPVNATYGGLMSHNSTVARPTTVNSTQVSLETTKPQIFPMETHSSLILRHVYPLYYYDTQRQITEPELDLQVPKGSNSYTAVLDTPKLPLTVECTEKGFLQSLFSCDGAVDASNKITQANLRGPSEKPPTVECDLSLRLGSLIPPRTSVEVVDIRLSSSQERSKSVIP